MYEILVVESVEFVMNTFFFNINQLIIIDLIFFKFNITLHIIIVIQVIYANNNTKTLLIIPIFTLLAKNTIIYITYNKGYLHNTGNAVLYI